MKEQIGLRRALEADAAVLQNVRQEARQACEFKWPPARDLTSRLAASGVFTYLAESEIPFGFITVGTPDDELFESTGEVLEWYLVPAKWKSGFGRKLLVHGLSVLKRRQFEQALIWLPESAIAAGKTAAEIGFEQAAVEKEVNLDCTTYVQKAFVKDLSEYF